MKEVQPLGDFEPDRRAEHGEGEARDCLESGVRCASGAEARLLWWDAINPVTSVMKPRTAAALADRLNLHWSYWRVSEV